MEACRDWHTTTQLSDQQKALSSWEFSIHQRDEYNNPAYANLPPVQGLALSPKDCAHLGASGKKIWSQRPIHAVPNDVVTTVDALIKDIIEAWEMMPE